MRRSTQGSSIRIDGFVFGLTLNSNKLDKKVKILGKLSWVLNCVNYFSNSLVEETKTETIKILAVFTVT